MYMSAVGAVPNNFYPTRLKRTPSILVHWPQTPVSGFLTMICMAEFAATPITLKAPGEWETGVGRYTRSPPRLSHAVQELSSQALWCTARSSPCPIRSILPGPQDTASIVRQRPSIFSRSDNFPLPTVWQAVSGAPLVHFWS